MSDERRGKLLKYGIGFLVCAVVTTAYAVAYGVGSLSLVDTFRVLCDAFTIPGIFAILIGLLIWVSGEGVFDGLGYVVSVAVKALTPFGRYTMETYYDYVERKKESRTRKISGYGFLFVIGLIWMAAAFVFYGLFYWQYS